MRSFQDVRCYGSLWRQILLVVILLGEAFSASHSAKAGTNITVWDTLSPFAGTLDLGGKSRWKAIPTDLFALEADPPKASSDPGYYGREYAFQGDAVVENQKLAAVFWSANGRVAVFSKSKAASATDGTFGRKVFEWAPEVPPQSSHITRYEILRNVDDEVVLQIMFGEKESGGVSAVFAFDKNEIIEVKPSDTTKGVHLFSPIAYGVVPSFIGDDLIFAPNRYASTDLLVLPAENVFFGLVKGEENMLVITWPHGKQQLKLRRGNASEGEGTFQSIEFENDGQSFYLAPLAAPGIWHREELKPSYLEKDIAIQWKAPFPAKWITQLEEAGVKTTFSFRGSKGQVWRGVPGSYSYPVWFEGENAFYHLSKKVPPKGESIIYFREGNETPASISTPVDIMRETLGRQTCEAILDPAGRRLRTHHRRGGAGVHRACTCGCTEAIQAVFEVGQEVEKKEYIKGALDDMIYFVQRHVERIDEYRHFADHTIQLLHAKAGSAPDLKPYLDGLEQIVQQIPQEYNLQKENMQSLGYADELASKTMALTAARNTNNLAAYMDLLKAWRAMGGAQDYIVAQCHAITRKLFQEAGYRCVDQPKTVALAQEIRARCRAVLRNADGYEIWPDY